MHGGQVQKTLVLISKTFGALVVSDVGSKV